MDPVLSAIDDALARTGLSDAAASKLAVGNPALIKNMRSARGEDKRYSFQSLNELARVLGLDCYFGPKRVFGGFAEQPSDSDLQQNIANQGGHLPIPWHPAMRKTGTSPVVFLYSWLASEGLAPEHLQAIAPKESLLSFTTAKNTVAVIQTNAAQKGSGGVWCFQEGNTLGIARTVFLDGKPILLPRTESEEVRTLSKSAEPTARLLGKVVWLGMLT